MKTFQNPILPGFYPDPTICKVNDDYYVCTSTFCYFPGVPIFHSKDLVNWEQIGNVLDREEQLPLMGDEMSRGIFAPTLRYHNGTFYMITTNIDKDLGNFLVTAKDPSGPWSDPVPLGAAGIDPSLFFDDDGKCYYCGTKERREGSRYFGDNEIYIQELDLETLQLVGESYPAWHGALRNVVWPEGPHIYKKDGYYYLMISEAGTAHEHAISIARSKSLKEPFEGYKGNPICTHRYLGRTYPIVNVGHPDIVETDNGEWWMVLLASRTYGGYYRNLGRETYLVPMTWEDGWPLINPGKGIVEDEFPVPNLPEFKVKEVPAKEDFDCDKLPLHFLYIRNPEMSNYDLKTKPSYLTMKLSKELLSGYQNPSGVFVRQTSIDFTAETSLLFTPKSENEEAGLVIFQSQSFNYQLLVSKNKASNSVIRLLKVERDETTELNKIELDSFYENVTLKMVQNCQDLSFFYKVNDAYVPVAINLDARMLSTDVAGGFIGNTIGIYATSNGKDTDTTAAFDYLEVK